jgi:hypothetical protein
MEQKTNTLAAKLASVSVSHFNQASFSFSFLFSVSNPNSGCRLSVTSLISHIIVGLACALPTA